MVNSTTVIRRNIDVTLQHCTKHHKLSDSQQAELKEIREYELAHKLRFMFSMTVHSYAASLRLIYSGVFFNLR